MDTHNNSIPMLELLLRPAFCVESGRITRINSAAAAYLLEEGAEIMPLLATGQEEYAAFTGGCLYLTLAIGPKPIGATVVCVENHHLFLIEQDEDLAPLRILTLAAQQLRQPLSGINAAADQLITEDSLHMSQIYQRMHQMMRIISNMSDAMDFCQAGPEHMEWTDLTAQLKELLNGAATQLQAADIHLEYTLPPAPVITLADRDRVERAVYNMLSNAAKHTPAGGKIRFEMVQRGRLYLSVTDEGPNTPDANAYTRYLRSPSVTDGQEGMGLGILLIRTTAALHGGTVLIDRPKDGGTRVTMTLQLCQHTNRLIRSPLMRIDYAGERDHGLQELADVLPTSLYTPGQK